jgi:hypothetical protein
MGLVCESSLGRLLPFPVREDDLPSLLKTPALSPPLTRKMIPQ